MSFERERHHPPTTSSEEEGEQCLKVPSSSEEGVGGGGAARSGALYLEDTGGGVSPDTLKHHARTMRNNPTEPEKRLWMALRGNRFAGVKFRRQDVIGQRIVDFFCPARGVVIEADGDTHYPAADVMRDAWMLRDHGFVTVRFSNFDVMRNLEGCLMQLRTALEKTPERWAGRVRHHPPTPSSKEEGEQ
jgi:very-short-patch-repair endonuclease